MKPFIKWAGGKTTLLEKIFEHFPSDIDTYYEPFVGGGSVFLHLLGKIKANDITCNRLVISDLNEKLINTYLAIQNNHEELLERLQTLSDTYGNLPYTKRIPRFKYDLETPEACKGHYYYWCREQFNNTDDTIYQAALFIFLNKTGFRGLYREGNNGFNVPFGNYKSPTVFTTEQINLLHDAFNDVHIEFICRDFSEINPEAGDFIYFDPPYYPLNDKSFVAYQKDGFYGKHEVLAELCRNLGAMFVLSNSRCEFNIKNFPYNQEKILCSRRINSKNPADSDYEILVWKE